MGGNDIDGGADGTPPTLVGGGEMDGGFDGAGEIVVVLWPPVVVGMGETEGGIDGAGDAVVFSARSRFSSLEDRPGSDGFLFPRSCSRVMGKRPSPAAVTTTRRAKYDVMRTIR